MADTGTDFLTFLRANYPDDYIRLSSNDVSDKLVTAILHKHQAKFDIWKKVPERIRDEYFGRVPEDILEAARTDNNLTIDEVREIEQDRKEETHIPVDISLSAGVMACAAAKYINFSVNDMKSIYNKSLSVMDKGVSQKDAITLASYSTIRRQVSDFIASGNMPQKAGKELIDTAKAENRKIIKKWEIENKPENVLLRCYLDLNNGKTDKDSVLPEMFVLASKVKEQGRETELLKKLSYPQYKDIKEDTRILFNLLLQSHEIGNVNQSLNKTRSKVNKNNDNNKTFVAYQQSGIARAVKQFSQIRDNVRS